MKGIERLNKWNPIFGFSTPEEVSNWDKYPNRFRNLPPTFDNEKTDSKIIKESASCIFENDLVLTSIKDVLGEKRKRTIKTKSVPWGEIYVLNAIGTTLYKIGHSTNFQRRFRDLNTSSPLPLRVIKYARCDNPNLLEQHLHDKFKDNYFKNEWFSLMFSDLIEIENILNNFFE